LGPELQMDQYHRSQAAPPDLCGAMVQQDVLSHRGNQSVPQGLLHLVGCREKGRERLPEDPAKR
jgi:hypothetical protein